ncbi:tRNA dihydrouridine synthase DusB [Candidatus Uhrbacteria bacterium]|nr:tRNA dihydrouridine synthase DusB [Candidatus Uhrbacteria bacterium]
MKLDWETLQRPILALSPMADMTDSAFCRAVRKVVESKSHSHGVESAGLLTPRLSHDSKTQRLIIFREMVSSEAVVRENQKTFDMTAIHPDERPIVQQLFGSDPDVMAEAARKIEEAHHPEGFDINMGCPVYKIVHNFNGAALMNEPERSAKIVRKLKTAVSVPVSVKIRTGWSDPTQCLEFARVLENAGVDMITVHGRTKLQGYSGKSDWDRICEVKQQVSIPVLANGDIHTAELTLKVLEQTGCDGVSIARGALGNPWIFKQICEALDEKTPTLVEWNERIEVMKKHFALHIEQYGLRGVPTFRKHVSWYLRGIAGAKKYKEKLHTATSVEEVNFILDEMICPVVQQ